MVIQILAVLAAMLVTRHPLPSAAAAVRVVPPACVGRVLAAASVFWAKVPAGQTLRIAHVTQLKKQGEAAAERRPTPLRRRGQLPTVGVEAEYMAAARVLSSILPLMLAA
jgi:hypothetical protein